MNAEVRSYAKVNLWLRVAGRRADGFHDIETVFHTISLHDDLRIEAVDSTVEVAMSPHVEANLAERAARALASRAGSEAGARIDIRKSIPLGAGLAGGSGNAAAVLIALNELWGLQLSRGDLLTMAADLGSDVPFLLEGGTSLGLGRGERLVRLEQPPRMWFVLGISTTGLSTGAVYEAWRQGSTGPSLDEFHAALEIGRVEEIAQLIRNDLEGPACELRPELADKKASMVTAGALGSFISGSGPTVVGIARDERHARSIATNIREGFDRTEVVHSHPSGVEWEGRAPL